MIKPFSAVGINPVLDKARDFPIYGCWVMKEWQSMGLTPVVIARQQAPDQIMFAQYLVDLLCLGVKNAYTRADFSVTRFERELEQMFRGLDNPCSAEFAHELVYGAIEYAEKLGLQPHPDFYKQKADLMLDPPDAHPRKKKIKFGQGGKPMYVPGPSETQHQIQLVLSKLRETCGEGNYNFLIGGMDV